MFTLALWTSMMYSEPLWDSGSCCDCETVLLRGSAMIYISPVMTYVQGSHLVGLPVKLTLMTAVIGLVENNFKKDVLEPRHAPSRPSQPEGEQLSYAQHHFNSCLVLPTVRLNLATVANCQTNFDARWMQFNKDPSLCCRIWQALSSGPSCPRPNTLTAVPSKPKVVLGSFWAEHPPQASRPRAV